jgi:hypothetical protein
MKNNPELEGQGIDKGKYCYCYKCYVPGNSLFKGHKSLKKYAHLEEVYSKKSAQ